MSMQVRASKNPWSFGDLVDLRLFDPKFAAAFEEHKENPYYKHLLAVASAPEDDGSIWPLKGGLI